jgi:hypothetical protein
MSIHVCKCTHNGKEEYHLRYPGMTEKEALELASAINGADFGDTARLNWLSRQYLSELSMYLIMDAPGDGNIAVHGDSQYGEGRTLRLAIDDAMSK